MHAVLKMVTRVKDERGDAGLFKDDSGKISYLDKRETTCKLKVGDKALAWVVTSKERYDFVRLVINGYTIQEVVNLFSKFTNSDLLNLNVEIISLINSFSNRDTTYNTVHNYTDIALPNLKEVVVFYDKIGVNTELADWICSSLDVMQFMYNKFSDDSESNVVGTVGEANIEELKKELFSKEEFDLELAIKIHTLERERSKAEKRALEKFDNLLKSIASDEEYICDYGPRNYTYTVKRISRHNYSGIEMYGTDENGFQSVEIISDIDKIDFIDSVNSISVVRKVWEK